MARLNEPRVHADVTNLCTSMNYYETEQDAKATPTEHQIAAVRRLLLHPAGPFCCILCFLAKRGAAYPVASGACLSCLTHQVV